MLNGLLGATLMLGSVVAFAGLGASPAQAQCSDRGYYTPRASYGSCYQPRVVYSSSVGCAPAPVVCYDTPRYRPQTIRVSIGGQQWVRQQRWRGNCR